MAAADGLASSTIDANAALLERLREIAGTDAVIHGPEADAFCTDVYRSLCTPIAVVRPGSVEILQAVVGTAAQAGIAMFPRGGGASYTDGYLPTRPDSLLIDTGGLDRIVEINAADAFVTVEAGVTWARLKAALDPLGLRTPFFGPFSGLVATVGGSVSQNALSHGSGAHGVSAESVLSLDMVTASGALIRTGSAARGSAPHARHYGPDLTGLFTGDCGALGIKVRVTLALLSRKPAFGCASFAFDSFSDLAGAMRACAMARLDDEHFAIDAALQQGQIARRQDAQSVFAMARAVFSSIASPIRAIAQLGRMAVGGARVGGRRGGARRSGFTLHVIVEGLGRRDVEGKLRHLRALTRSGTEIANMVPSIVRAMPFAPLTNTLGPAGERWIPVHGILPHSKVTAFHVALQALYANHATRMKALGVWTGGMFETVGPSGFLYEVALYWPGAQTVYHLAAIPAAHRAPLQSYADDARVGDFVHVLKEEIVALFGSFGAVHFQLGKSYPYARIIAPENAALLRSIKAALDPAGLMNPGALGLGGDQSTARTVFHSR